jgi:phosphopantetheinyl transferase (holo-ACP synthase)
MKNTYKITLEFYAGTHFSFAAREAISLAVVTGKPVDFNFNDVALVAVPSATPERIYEFYRQVKNEPT